MQIQIEFSRAAIFKRNLLVCSKRSSPNLLANFKEFGNKFGKGCTILGSIRFQYNWIFHQRKTFRIKTFFTFSSIVRVPLKLGHIWCQSLSVGENSFLSFNPQAQKFLSPLVIFKYPNQRPPSSHDWKSNNLLQTQFARWNIKTRLIPVLCWVPNSNPAPICKGF